MKYNKFKKPEFKPGKHIKFVPKNKNKYIGNFNQIIARSTWELKFFNWCDNNPNVLKWNSEGLIISYFDSQQNKWRKYYTDVYMELVNKDGEIKKYVVEIKPKKETKPPRKSKNKSKKTIINEQITYQNNQDKWFAAKDYCSKHGFKFIILTEKELFNK